MSKDSKGIFDNAQLNRIEQEVKALRNDLKQKEQLDRIEALLKEIKELFGDSSEAAELADQLKNQVDELQSDVDSNKPKT